jgi:hypothetical protein
MLAALALFCSCSKAPEAPAVATKAQGATPASQPSAAPQTTAAASIPAAAPASAAEASSAVTGKVLETQDAAGYTYVKLRTPAGDQWAAVSQTKVETGRTVTIDAQMTVDNFESKTLKRKFDKIIFGSIAGAAPASAPAAMMSSAQMPPGHPGVAPAMNGSPMGTAAQHMAGPADVGNVAVPKAEGANAMTVAEVWKNKDSLNDKPVVIRGTVVKALSGIMGRNWVHLRDGSGSAEAGTHDVTVTTDETAAVGDVVVVSGVVHTDKDFGAGYLYPVIIENAKIRK